MRFTYPCISELSSLSTSFVHRASFMKEYSAIRENGTLVHSSHLHAREVFFLFSPRYASWRWISHSCMRDPLEDAIVWALRTLCPSFLSPYENKHRLQQSPHKQKTHRNRLLRMDIGQKWSNWGFIYLHTFFFLPLMIITCLLIVLKMDIDITFVVWASEYQGERKREVEKQKKRKKITKI